MAEQKLEVFSVNTIVIFQQRFCVHMMNICPHQTDVAVVDLGEGPLIRPFCPNGFVPFSLLIGAPLKGNCSFIKIFGCTC